MELVDVLIKWFDCHIAIDPDPVCVVPNVGCALVYGCVQWLVTDSVLLFAWMIESCMLVHLI